MAGVEHSIPDTPSPGDPRGLFAHIRVPRLTHPRVPVGHQV